MIVPSAINSLSIVKDCLGKIFSYLSLTEIQENKRVCKLWMSIMNSKEFLASAHPRLNYLDSGWTSSPTQFVALANRFEDKLQSLDFTECQPLTDNHLENVKARFSKVKFGSNKKVTEYGVITVLNKMNAPIELSINNGTDVNVGNFFVLARNLPKIIKLDLSLCTFGAVRVVNAEALVAFRNFVDRGGLESPCSLGLRLEKWVNRSVFEALVVKRVQVKSLDVRDTSCTIDDLQYLLDKNGFTKICKIKFDEKLCLNDTFVDGLITQGIKLNQLYLTQRHTLSVQHLDKLVRLGLNNRCSFEIYLSNLTLAFANAVIESQIEIHKIIISLDFLDANEESQKAFSLIFSKAKFARPFKLELMQFSEPFNNKMFECLKIPRLKIDKFVLKGEINSFPQSVFIEMCNRKIFVENDFDLILEINDWNFTEVISALNRCKSRFRGLSLNGPTENDITPLVRQLQNLQFLNMGTCNLSILQKLKKSQIRNLDILFDQDDKLIAGFLEILRGNSNFVNLMIIDCDLTEIETVRSIQNLRPHIQIIHDCTWDDE